MFKCSGSFNLFRAFNVFNLFNRVQFYVRLERSPSKMGGDNCSFEFKIETKITKNLSKMLRIGDFFLPHAPLTTSPITLFRHPKGTGLKEADHSRDNDANPRQDIPPDNTA